MVDSVRGVSPALQGLKAKDIQRVSGNEDGSLMIHTAEREIHI